MERIRIETLAPRISDVKILCEDPTIVPFDIQLRGVDMEVVELDITRKWRDDEINFETVRVCDVTVDNIKLTYQDETDKKEVIITDADIYEIEQYLTNEFDWSELCG